MDKFNYTPDVIAFIQAHWNIDMAGPDIAAHLGIPHRNLNASVYRLRKMGYELESKILPIGHVRIAPRKGKNCLDVRVKTENGWEYQKVGKEKGNADPKPKQPKQKPVKPITQPMPRPTKNKPVPRKPATIDANKTAATVRERDNARIAAGWVWVVDAKTRSKSLRSPEKLTA